MTYRQWASIKTTLSHCLLAQCWPNVVDVGLTLKQRLASVSCRVIPSSVIRVVTSVMKTLPHP